MGEESQAGRVKANAVGQARPLPPKFEVASGQDANVEEIKSLLNFMLLNKRDSFKAWLKAIMANDIKFCDSTPTKLNKSKRKLRRSYELALERVDQQESTKQKIAEISKLACLNFIPEADVWYQRAQTARARAKLGRLSATTFLENAEEYYAKAYFHYRDLRDKYLELNSQEGLEANTDVEAHTMQAKMDEIRPRVFQTRIDKHSNHILLSLTGNMDPKQLLFSVVSLLNTFAEYDPVTGKPLADTTFYDPKEKKLLTGSKIPVHDFMQVRIYEHIKALIVDADDVQQCKQIFTQVTKTTFRNLLDVLYWLIGRGGDFRFNDLIEQELHDYELAVEDVVEVDWKMLGNNVLLNKILPRYIAKLEAYIQQKKADGKILNLNQGKKLQLLQQVRDDIIEQKRQQLVAEYPNDEAMVAQQCQQYQGSIDDGLTPYREDISRLDILRQLKEGYDAKVAAHRARHGRYIQLNDTTKIRLLTEVKQSLVKQREVLLFNHYPVKTAELSSSLWHMMGAFRAGVVDAMKTIAIKHKKAHPELQNYMSEAHKMGEQEYLESHDDYAELQEETRKAGYNVLRSIMGHKLWYPEVGKLAGALNPTEIDMRDEQYDDDMIEDLSRHHRSSMCLGG